VNVISKAGLKKLAAKLPETTEECLIWFRVARKAEWKEWSDIRRDFPSADQVGSVVIFNIRHNRYRLITRVDYLTKRVFVKALLTHKEYMRKEWMKWA
jgi:mRNA interferase HigB